MNEPHAHRSLRLVAVALLTVLATACRAFEEGRDQPVTPQRPTISSDTRTPVAGHLELEVRLAVAPGDELDTPTQLRWGLDSKSEVHIGWSPYQWVDTPVGDLDSVGDISVGYKARFLDQAGGRRPSLAADVSIKIPTADEDDGIGTGEFDIFLAGIADWSDEDWSTTGYAQLGLLGVEDEPRELDGQYILALAAGKEIEQTSYDWAAFGEIAGIWVPERDSEEGFLTLGAFLPWTVGRVFDVSLAFGLTGESPDYILQFGFTTGLGVMGPRVARQ